MLYIGINSLFSVFVLYCIVGYIINGVRSKNWGDVTGNIPNFNMWKTLPKASIAGCIFTYGWCRGKCSKSGTQDMDEPLADE